MNTSRQRWTRFGQFIVVSTPSIFILFRTVDALLVPAPDVFMVALAQVLFIGGFVGYLHRTSSRPDD